MQRLMNATLATIVVTLALVACGSSRTPQAPATQKCADVMAPGTSCSVR